MKRLAAAAALLAAAACAGCGSSAHTLRPGGVPRAVLQPSDLPGWTRFQNDPGTQADTGALGSPGRTGDWIARYRSSRGIVVSRVDLYRSAKAAHTAYENLQSQVKGGTSAQLPRLGDERFGYRSGPLITAALPSNGEYHRQSNVRSSAQLYHGPQRMKWLQSLQMGIIPVKAPSILARSCVTGLSLVGVVRIAVQ